jgi:hypothetical protein
MAIAGWLLLVAFGSLGLALCVVGGVMLWRRLRALFSGPSRLGEIVLWEVIRPSALDRHAAHDAGPPLRPRFVPHVAYTAADGQRHTARVSEQYGRAYRKRHPTGSAFALHPNARNPAVGYPASAPQHFVLPALLLCAGGLVLLLALGMAFGRAAG